MVEMLDEGCWTCSCQAGGEKAGGDQRRSLDEVMEEMEMVGVTGEEADDLRSLRGTVEIRS